MASYASIASKVAPVVTPSTGAVLEDQTVEKEIADWLALLSEVTTPPESLAKLVDALRNEMEIPSGVFRAGQRNFGGAPPSQQISWRGLASSQPVRPQRSAAYEPQVGGSRFGGLSSAFDTRSPRPNVSQGQTHQTHQTHQPQSPNQTHSAQQGPRTNPGRYQSRFKAMGNIEDKILNTVIGNKLNAFTPLTYNDTRDFIYQIMDSGETEFTRDFIEKVFTKATLEDLYCPLFAKLIAEIAHRYPVIYEEMNKYHKEFLKIFDDVQEDSETEYTILVKQKQYRMGYGQFIAELAGLNALEKSQLIAMVTTVFEKIWVFSEEDNRTKAVEEFIDCLIRLTTGLRERSIVFFNGVKKEIEDILIARLNILISKTEVRQTPSLSNKGRFGLMDLKDILKSS